MTAPDYGHLDVATSERGFAHLPPVPGFRDQTLAAAYESSNAEEPCIWLRVEDRTSEATAQLPVEKAWALAEQLMYLVSHHYQGDGTPDWALTHPALAAALYWPADGER